MEKRGMKKTLLAVGALCANTLFAATVEPTAVSVRQNWPWERLVYIDCTLEGEGTCDLDFAATWRGRTEPLRLTSGTGLTGRIHGVGSGAKTFVWDPQSAGITGSLADFRVVVTSADAALRVYLVIDLESGAYDYLADIPSGGWTDEHKTTRMVFRRIAAGTFTMGASDELRQLAGFSDAREKDHAVTISSDYYLAIFPMTRAQYRTLSGDTTVANTKIWHELTYTNVRGTIADGVNWPTTGYNTIKSGSLVAMLRAKSPEFLFDLPTEAMWEYAARAGSEGLWYATENFPGGGTSAELGSIGSEACTNLLNSIAQWLPASGESVGAEVGTRLPNAWGIYDAIGLFREWCLDATNLAALPDATDPTGIAATAGNELRMIRGSASTDIKDVTIPRRVARSVANGSNCRIAIHLERLDVEESAQ